MTGGWLVKSDYTTHKGLPLGISAGPRVATIITLVRLRKLITQNICWSYEASAQLQVDHISNSFRQEKKLGPHNTSMNTYLIVPSIYKINIKTVFIVLSQYLPSTTGFLLIASMMALAVTTENRIVQINNRLDLLHVAFHPKHFYLHCNQDRRMTVLSIKLQPILSKHFAYSYFKE